MDVVPAGDSGGGVGVEGRGWEEVLPEPVFGGEGVFFFQCAGEVGGPQSFGEVFFVEELDAFDVLSEGGDHAVGQHGDSVVASFSVVDKDAVVVEVYVFDAQAEAFHEAESGSVHDLSHEFVGRFHGGDDGAGFFFGEDDGDAFAFFGTGEVEEGLVELEVEDVAVEEEDGADGLVLGGGGGLAFDDEVGDELADLFGAHFFGVAFVVVEDVFANPFEVGFFGARGVLFEADVVAVVVEEFFGLGGCGLHGVCPCSVRSLLACAGIRRANASIGSRYVRLSAWRRRLVLEGVS